MLKCPDNDKEEGERKKSHRATGNMLCPMILPGNTWQKKRVAVLSDLCQVATTFLRGQKLS